MTSGSSSARRALVASTLLALLVVPLSLAVGIGPAGAAPPGLGDITTLVGSSAYGYAGDGGPAHSAQLRYPSAVAVDAAADLVVADTFNNVVRIIAAASCSSSCAFGLGATTAGDIYTIAGNASFGYSGDSGPARAAQLGDPSGVALDAAGNLLIADTSNDVLRMVAASSCASSCAYGLSATTADDIYTIAGSASFGYRGDGGPAISAELGNPTGISLDAAGNLLIADSSNNVVRMVAASSCASSCAYGLSATTAGDIYTIAGNASFGYRGDGGPAISAELGYPSGVALDGGGNLLIADSSNNVVRMVAASSCASSCAYGLSATTADDIYTIAGSASFGYRGDGGPSASAQLGNPNAVSVDRAGNLLIVDTFNNVVRMVAASSCASSCAYGLDAATQGDIYTIAGNGGLGYSGDGGQATAAQLRLPSGVAIDDAGNLLIADSSNNVVRDLGGLVAPRISNLPDAAIVGGGFTATVSTNAVGVTSVTSSTPSVCTVSGFAVTYVKVGVCSLVAHVVVGSGYEAADGLPQAFVVSTPAPYHPISPTRICDTRAVQSGVVANPCNGQGAGPGTLSSGGTMNVTVTGGAVPSTATAVVLNVAVTGTSSGSFLSVYPTGTSRTTASNLNWTAGTTIPNLVEVPVGVNGQVSLYNLAGQADVVIDVEGYVGPGTDSYTGLYNPLSPARICDTRAAVVGAVPNNQCNGQGAGAETMSPGQTKVIAVDNYGGVPTSGVSAVALNVAVTNTTNYGFLAVWPDGVAKSSASNLNWSPGQTIANRVVVPVGADGKIDLYNSSGSTDVVVDVTGWFTDSSSSSATGSRYLPVTATRICDTRAASGLSVVANQCNNSGVGTGTLGTGSIVPVAVVGKAGVPTGAPAAVLNVAVTGTSASSFLTIWPNDGSTRPNASDLNWTPGVTIPNLVVATLPTAGANAGSVKVFNLSGAADVVVDVEGYYLPAGA